MARLGTEKRNPSKSIENFVSWKLMIPFVTCVLNQCCYCFELKERVSKSQIITCGAKKRLRFHSFTVSLPQIELRKQKRIKEGFSSPTSLNFLFYATQNQIQHSLNSTAVVDRIICAPHRQHRTRCKEAPSQSI